MFILPTRGRPDKMKRLIDACVDTDMHHLVYCYVDDDDPKLSEYIFIKRPVSWAVEVIPRASLWEIYKRHFDLFPNLEFYGFLGDDLIPQTKHWDQILVNEAGNDGVSYGDDLLQGRRLATHPVVAGDLARRMSWLVYPGLNADTAWHVAAQELGCLRYRPDVILEHMHWINGKADWDDTYDVGPAAMKADPRAIEQLVASIREKHAE